MTTGEGMGLALSWLATYGLHSTLFLGGAWLVCRFRPPRLDRNRERLWKLGLLGGFLSATLQLGLGARAPFGHFELASRDVPAPETARPEDAADADGTPGLPLPASGIPALSPPTPRANGEQRRTASTRAPSLAFAEREPLKPHVPRLSEPSAPDARDEGDEVRSAPPGDLALRVDGASEAAPASSSVREAPALTGPVSARSGFDTSARAWSARGPGLVLALWTALGALGLLGLFASWTGLRRRMLGRERLHEGPLFERFERLCARAKLGRRVRLSVSARIATPFSTGLLRPEVCLPTAALSALTPAQQEALLAHELAHLVRRDPAWFGLGYLIERVFFFQPLNRLARREIGELAETACDDWAVRWTGARLALASCLAEVAGWVLAEKPRLVTPPGLAGRRSRLGQRVERLLDDRRSPSGEPPAPWWPPLAAGALGLVALVGPGVSAAEPERTPIRPSPLPLQPTPATPEPPPLWSLSGSEVTPPGPPSAQPAAEVGPATVDERGTLEAELGLLEGELAALHAEFEARALGERFQAALASIDARMETLRHRHRRVSELLALLSELEASDAQTARHSDPIPTAEPPPTETPVPEVLEAGESR